MKTEFSLLFYLKRQKNHISGPVPVYLRINVAGKRSEMTSGLECDPDKWNTKSGRQDGKRRMSEALTPIWVILQSMIYQSHKSLFDLGEAITAESIKCNFIDRIIRRHTLLLCITTHDENMEVLVGRKYAIGTLRPFQVLERRLASFMKKKFRSKTSRSKT